ncbi:C4-dicarboxylate transporter/malic acid transport protein [Aspergillus homomorphus CBS 101889]|uniref:C4-dicarboxylate transporter/malic acid transport protein n=1 Tax=Aspergillus homomorphus (strain CBS 101889) TaxID=1450537 RepID=A0A395I7N5_ASPHC|nr:C4-dicarboxylate transporter/malic acid transport protein [Aspergillus homomorphus CBS 101889]RAL15819.1 C4-dicarboxylate transporter/malic acid transport protein [Aspergillus homomorphus CBS 101889]
MESQRVSFLDRKCRVAWGWFSFSSSTGHCYLAVQLPHKFHGLLTSLIIRFYRFRHALLDTFYDPEESYLIATAALDFATILFGIEVYEIPACGMWLRGPLPISLAVGMKWHLYRIRMATRQPFWLVRLLPSFPAMLGGTIASLLTSAQPSYYANPMLIAGTAMQGFGFMTSVFVLSEYIHGLHHQGLPPVRRRPQMFIAVGPPAFPAVALMGMAQTAPEKLPTHLIPIAGQVNTADVLLVMAVFISIFLWIMALFFWSIGWLSILDAHREWKSDITWWATVFPNTGFALSIIKIGDLLDSSAIKRVGTAATLIQMILWLGSANMHIWAYFAHRTLWPSQDEGFGPDEHHDEAVLNMEGEVRSYKGSSNA